MKFTFKALTLAFVSLALIATPALGGQKHHGNHHGNNNHYSYNNHHGGHHKNHHRVRHHRSHHKAGHIIGGIIGGVILANVINDLSNKHHQTYTYTRTYSNYPTYYRQNNTVINNSPVTTYRVLNGNECFLVNINQYGNDVLTQVPGVNCGF